MTPRNIDPPERIWVLEPAQAAKHSIFGVVIADYRADERYVEYVRADLADAGWQDISTAPRDGAEFQTWCVNYDGSLGQWEPRTRFNPQSLKFETWCLCDVDTMGWGEVDEYRPTHWQPLPAPPVKNPPSD